MTPSLVDTPVHALRESLQADTPAREASIAKLLAASCAILIPFVFLANAEHAIDLPLGVSAFLTAVVAYELIVLWLLRRGSNRVLRLPITTLIETSLPVPILFLSAKFRGPEFTLMSPVHVIWGALVVASALRSRPRLSMAAGTLAATEWLAVYFLWVRPQLAPFPLSPLMLNAALLRAVCLQLSGALGAVFAAHFMRKAEDALRSVREQDLMSKYFLHERIGQGGMAEVFRATYCPEGGFKKPVAIKRVLPSAAKSFNAMFLEEARLCAMLAHPNIVQVFDCGKFQNNFILAMEYVDGLALNRLLHHLSHPLPLSAVSFIGAELAAALEYIHHKVDTDGVHLRLVHRDLNPPNILFSRIGEVKLGDFGVANVATRVQSGRSDVVYGKVNYAAPEQLRLEPSDGRADLFALGLTLHEALTGKRVYNQEGLGAIRDSCFQPIVAASSLRGDVPPELESLISELVALNPDDRPGSGAAVRSRLTSLQGEAAPYPFGQQALARAVEEAMAARGARALLAVPNEKLTDAFSIDNRSRTRKRAADTLSVSRFAGDDDAQGRAAKPRTRRLPRF